ncbi:MAG: glycosyltransferase family 1 protein [Pelatocladus maniniholoensis HA4357-MV3]|uniref:Glycosyltransferase family 1 protein n=1 Tax=Pelatocladus maniniholoensis HA4357-MV3 TaxID=1117104 RepID=A0A9E3H885_9NOST|nr:glycosyltransferase family 1 protein [Pelatocladus maniniholoensis HA4357-MV3]
MNLKNQPRKIIQIVPQLPPAINGLGDYALNLARQLRKDYEIETHFIVGDRHWNGATAIEDFSIQKVEIDSAEALLSLLSSDSNQSILASTAPILLHYVGYGYANKGCPVWLVKGLELWKAKHTNSQLVTMFHEVYASGSPWTSAFWLSPLQQNIAARLLKLSDRSLTSKVSYAEILYKLARIKQGPITSVPVFSNIGEPESESVSSLAKRSRRLVVFGHRNSRSQVYQQCHKALEQICQTLKITEICDIGISTGLELFEINGIPILEKGVVEAAEVSKILLDSVAGFLNVPPPTHLAKSTIFAAYCVHKLIPCMTTSSKVPIDGLQGGKHYWSTGDQDRQLCLDLGQEIADNAYAWYQNHNLSTQAQIFANYLGANSDEE